jgi:CRISPR/Cas system CSM-associated protein Csm2 small subunit
VSPETNDKGKAFHNFISFFEAIVAYHKAEENK